MYPEYLFNNDTQDMSRRVRELAAKDEPTLRAHCIEVSRQTDTSSLAAKGACVEKANNAKAVLANVEGAIKMLLASFANQGTVFGTQNSRTDFSSVCRAVTEIEEERLHLLSCIRDLTQLRQTVFGAVAEANRALHLLLIAGHSAPEEVRSCYTEITEQTKVAYLRLREADDAIREVSNFYMTFIEQHLPAFMESLRSAADFKGAGASLNKGAIRTICNELLILTTRTPNVSF